MARIRSVHPGLFTDEAFMAASMPARLLLIGVWCEAFDDGAFEIKPLTLKARIFPVDKVKVETLLAELEELGWFQRFTSGGKEWGALRNFRRFQRPKKPNSSKALPVELHDFVGIGSAEEGEDASSADPVPNQSPTSSRKAAQMEDGGWKGRVELEEKKQRGSAVDEPAPAEPSRADDLRSFEQLCRHALADVDPPKGSFAPMALLLERGADADEVGVVLRAEAAKPRRTPIGSWAGWAKIVSDRLTASAPTPVAARPTSPLQDEGPKVDTPYAGRLAVSFLRAEHAAGRWRAGYGPEPGKPGCLIDATLEHAA